MTATTLDQSRSIEEAASDLGVTVDRLSRWMERNEWVSIQDTSWDVSNDQIEFYGHLINKNGIRVTPKGMDYLRKRVRPPLKPTEDLEESQPESAVASVGLGDGVPF